MHKRENLISGAVHRTPSETDQVGVGRVGASHDAMLFCQRQGLLHYQWITTVETAGDISLVDVRHDLVIAPHCPRAVTFA